LLRDNGAPLSEALSWMITALGYVSNAGDAEVLTLLRETLASSRETSELIRFWSLVALTRIGDAAAGQSISASDRTGLVGMLADALRERGAPRAPSALLAALLGPNEYPQWSALLVLRVVAFPSLIPQMCELLQRVSKNPSSQVPYNVLLALANPEIVDAAARALESSLGTRVVVENAVRAMRNSSLRRVAEFARVVMRLDKRGVERSLNGLAASPDENTAQAALVLMERLGLEELEEIAPVAGYLTDSIPEANQALKDEIGIDKDVKTLCSVLLAAEVKPPLAGGLFGDWGTGKSYFMEKMYREIETLAERAKNAKKTAYLKRVVQIRFNAWHYADANLWASLVTHIFDELSKEVNKEESPEETKKRLMSQLDSAKQALNDAVIEQKRAKGESDAAEASLSRVRQDRVDKQIELKQLRVPDLWEILNADEQKELKKELTTAIEELSLEPAIGSVKELNDVYQQAVTLAGRARSAFLSLWRSKDRASLMVLVVFAFVLVPVVGYAITEVVHKAKLAEWIASVSEALVFLGGFAPKIKKHLDTASRYLKQLEEARARALEVIGERRKMVSDAERVKERELERLRVEETAAAQRVAMADAKVLEVTQKLEEIKSGRSLSKFLLERVQADDYRKHLGIVSLIRKDFERLNDLLTKGEGGLEQIGRIILYIDDLDRCPADKVVDVLQATHLLLAMKLFVAIVGVDLRWLLHSLDQRYSAFRADANGDAKGLRPEWVTSPQSYLEKIFQIPFNLKPMEPAGYERLISSLFPKGAEALVPSPGPQEHLDEPAPQDAGQQELLVYVAQKSQMGPQPPTPNAEASKQTAELVDRDLDPAALVIRDWERDFAARMFPFVPSPRAAKRFTNIYRILKAPLASGELREFEGTKESPGDFQAAMLLLAVSTGLPYQTAELFRAILAEGKKLGADGRPSGTWKDIFERFIVEPEKRSVLAQLKLTDRIDPFFKWAPRVGRFTFEAAKAAAKRAVAPEAGAAPNHAVV
ncbi:MAG: P-loop NTPase fold protein, partial [Candidatus Acidiferrum sp.]